MIVLPNHWSPEHGDASLGIGILLQRQNAMWEHTTSPLATKHKERIGLAKNSCVHVQLVQLLDKKTQKEQKNPTARSEKSGTKTGCQEQWPSKGMGKTPKPSLDTSHLYPV